MADLETQPQPEPEAQLEPGSAEWLDKKTAEPEPAAEKPAVETPAAPAAEAQPASEDNWYENGFADAKHGFLRGRKGPEVEQAFRATETEMKRAQLARKEAQEAAQQALARAAALELALQQRQQPPPEDPYKEVEQIYFQDGPAAAFKKNSEINARIIQAEAAKIASHQIQQFQQQSSDQARQDQQAKRFQSALDAANTARESLNIDKNVWDNERGLAVSARIINQFGIDGLTEVNNWTDVHNALYPAVQTPAPAPVIAATPVAANPPGSHRPAPVQPKPNAGLPTLDGEERRALEFLAEAGGVDPEKLIARHQTKARRANG